MDPRWLYMMILFQICIEIQSKKGEVAKVLKTNDVEKLSDLTRLPSDKRRRQRMGRRAVLGHVRRGAGFLYLLCSSMMNVGFI